ncbi:alpha/beta hydrolase family protein [Roseibium algae]|uniref:Dienelactone hydrolase n=1 Tax=Roseibium algae TaxID=3123038 RepID=A0ABU8TIP9_9HYPH
MRFISIPTLLRTYQTLKPAILCASIAVTALAYSQSQAAFQEQAMSGYDRFDIKAAHRNALVQGSIWYPASTRTYASWIGGNAVFQGNRVMLGAGIKPGRYPLVVLSHGTGGNMDGLGWLSSKLVDAGVLVVGLNHPGSTSQDITPTSAARVWERPQDISAAIDEILADPVFGPNIDQSRIYTLGFSLGGISALQSIGLQMDISAYADYCVKEPASQGCAFFARGGVDFRKLDQAKANASYGDPRLAGTIAIDPGLTVALTQDSIRANTKPSLLINLGSDKTLWKAINVGPTGTQLAARLPGARYLQIAPADHFSFLGLCKKSGPEILREINDEPVCDDPKGADRADIHRQVIEAVRDFIDLTSNQKG